MNINIVKRHKKITALILIIAFAAGYYFFAKKPDQSGQPVYTYGSVSRGTIIQSVSGTGQIAAAKQSEIKSKVAGTVLAVNVKTGSQIKAGSVLARIDDRTARDAVENAREALESAKISYDKLMEPASKLSLTQAQNALDQARESLADDEKTLENTYGQGFDSVADAFLDLPGIMAGLQDIVTGSNSYVIQVTSSYLEYYSDSIKYNDPQAVALSAKAAASYRKAKLRYDENFKNYRSLSRDSQKEKIEELISQTYQTANLVAEAIKDSHDLIQRYEDVLNSRNVDPQSFADTHLSSLSGYASKNSSHLEALYSSTQNIARAKNDIVNGQRSVDEKNQSLENLKEAPDELEIRSQKLTISQKERALADAVEKLDDYDIVAPFDGTVAAVEIEKGDEVAANSAVATLMTNNQVATVTLNEVDVAKVETGQKATLAFSAIDGLTITGKVAQIDPIGTVSQGVVSYEVTIALDTENEQIKPGMSISATIITQVRQNVLLVPVAAVKNQDSGSFIAVLQSDPAEGAAPETKQQAVTTGLSDDTNTEIIEGANEGDRIVTATSKQTSKTSASNNSNNNRSFFNMGGMGGPMR